MKVATRDFEALDEKEKLNQKNEGPILNMINHPFVVEAIDDI